MELPQVRRNDWLVLAWAPYSRRSETFARELGGKLYCIHYLRFQAPLYAPVKYVLQAIRTMYVLFQERPAAVHVQNPPFVCGLVVYLYCLLSGARFVLDHHSAAFASVWDWALPIQKVLARRAATNIVTNQHWADIVNSWGAHASIMVDPFLELPAGSPIDVGPGFSVAFVGTFAPDEPLDAVVEAARELPDIHLYVTGDSRRVSPAYLDSLPTNLTCTGFLPDEEYIGLLRSVDAIMVLTTRNYTLQLGGCEAVAVGKPIITSDWPFLKEIFSRGTIHVSNTATSIRDGVRKMRSQHKQLEKESLLLREDGRRKWNDGLAHLRQLDLGLPQSYTEKMNGRTGRND
jgi:glycosyltransferase involved in cell wall biosynthesis